MRVRSKSVVGEPSGRPNRVTWTTCAIVAGMAVLATVGCKRAVEERAKPVSIGIDLTTIASQRGDGQGPTPAAASPGAHALVLQPNQPLDLFFRVPANAQLVFGLPPGADPNQLSIDAESPKARASLRSDSWHNGGRAVSLAKFAEQRIRLRLTSRASGPLAIERPLVIGADAALPPLIERRPQLPEGQRLNVVLFVVDTLRADRLSAYGYGRETSPRLAELAARGTLFERAYAAGSSTWPSIKALYASRFPSELGENGLALRAQVPKTLAEVFRDAGYATASFNGNFSLIEELGFARGFETYELLRRETSDGPPEVSADVIYDRALAWVREHRDRPFFLYVQTMDVHGYDAPEPWRGKFTAPQVAPKPAATEEASKLIGKLSPEQIEGLKAMGKLSPEQLKNLGEFGDKLAKLSPEQLKAFKGMGAMPPEQQRNVARFKPDRYDEAIAYTDHVFGRFVDALGELGLADRTLVVFTADHGEPQGQRGQLFHGTSLHEELVHVPLVMLFPAGRAERIGRVVSLMDLAPTLADLAALPVPPRFVGKSLLRPPTRMRPPSAFGEQPPFPWGPKVEGRPYLWYAREGRWKLLMDPNRVALYDLKTDPGETKDVSAEHPIETGYLVGALTQRVGLLRGAPPPSDVVEGEARRKLDSALRALGYVE
jgi:arylsulfatase A-like enzyme